MHKILIKSSKCILLLLIFISCNVKPIINLDYNNVIMKFKNEENLGEVKGLIHEIFKHKKEFIPDLINSIDNKKVLNFDLGNPVISVYLKSDDNYYGVLAAYTIEIILANRRLFLEKEIEAPGLLWYSETYPYPFGFIVNNRTNRMIKKKDLEKIQYIYRNWWGKNKHKCIEELRKDWEKGKRVLEGSNYSWN